MVLVEYEDLASVATLPSEDIYYDAGDTFTLHIAIIQRAVLSWVQSFSYIHLQVINPGILKVETFYPTILYFDYQSKYQSAEDIYV